MVRDLHLDERVDVITRAPRLLQPLIQSRKECVGVQSWVLAACRDEAIGDATCQTGSGGAGGTDVDRYGSVGTVVDRRIPNLPELAVETDALAGPQLVQERERLLQATETFGRLGPRDAEGHLVEGFAGAHPQDDAPRVHHAEGREGLRHDTRVVAEGGGEHRRAEEDPGRSRPDGAEPRDSRRRMATLVHPGLQVVGDEHRVEPGLLGAHREVCELVWSELLG